MMLWLKKKKNMSVIPPKLRKGEGENKKERKKEKLGKTKKKRTSNNSGTSSKSLINVIRIPGKGKEKETEIFEVRLLRTFQNWTHTKPETQEAQRIPSRINTPKCTPM